MASRVTISRDPDDSWRGKRTIGFRGTDDFGPVNVIIDDEEWDAIRDIFAIEATDTPDDAFAEIEKLASRSEVTVSGDTRVIDLRPNFA